jgi:hypothetical protein
LLKPGQVLRRHNRHTPISGRNAKPSKRFWVTPAEWTVMFRLCGGPALLDAPAGAKQTYQDNSALVTALARATWQSAYEEMIDYYRNQLGDEQRPGQAQLC